MAPGVPFSPMKGPREAPSPGRIAAGTGIRAPCSGVNSTVLAAAATDSASATSLRTMRPPMAWAASVLAAMSHASAQSAMACRAIVTTVPVVVLFAQARDRILD